MTALLGLWDTHCHVHDQDYQIPADQLLTNCERTSICGVITMGSNLASSRLAIEYAEKYSGQNGVIVWAGVGVYPQETTGLADEEIVQLKAMTSLPSVCAIGEIGLDYYYDTVKKQQQIQTLEKLLQLAVDSKLSVSLHIRSGRQGDAFADLWPILQNFSGRIHGVIHSFTDSMANLDKILASGLSIGINGIETFNKDSALNLVYDQVPLAAVVLETDAPYLAPIPYRGKVNQPAYIRNIAESLATRRGVSLAELAQITTNNVQRIFGHKRAC